jgi:uncharacterized protein YndB with AHSA1/START domain
MARDIVLAVEIAKEPKAVFDTVATREGIAAFWTPDVQGDAAEGGELSLGFGTARSRLPLRVRRAAAPQEIEWAAGGDWPFWSGSRIAWSFEPSEASTKVILRHLDYGEGMPDDEFGSVAFTWATVLGRLKSVAESDGTLDPALR